MAYPAVGDPTLAFVDAIMARLKGDATLTAPTTGLVKGVFAHLSEAARTAYPYVVLGRRHQSEDGGAMTVGGGEVSLQIDTWSNYKGPYQVHQIHDRIYVLLQRQSLVVSGYHLLAGSVTREFADVFDEPDPDMPSAVLYHGVQRWVGEVHQP